MKKEPRKAQLTALLTESGVNTQRFKSFLEESIEVEIAVLYANPNKIPDPIYIEKKMCMREAQLICNLLA